MSRAFPQSTGGRLCKERCTIQNRGWRFGDVCSCKTYPYLGVFGETWDWDKCPDNECDD